MKSSHESKFAEWIGSKWVGNNRIITNFKINFMKKFFNKKTNIFKKYQFKEISNFTNTPDFKF